MQGHFSRREEFSVSGVVYFIRRTYFSAIELRAVRIEARGPSSLRESRASINGPVYLSCASRTALNRL